MPRPSSPLNAKASVRSPYALDRSQQNSCVTSVAAGRTKDRARSHMRFVLSLPDNDVFSGPPSKRLVEDWQVFSAGLTLHSRCQTREIRSGPGENSYVPRSRRWWSQTGSNRRPHACKARALPTELWPLSRDPQPQSCRSIRGLSFRDGRPGQTRTADLTLIRRTL